MSADEVEDAESDADLAPTTDTPRDGDTGSTVADGAVVKAGGVMEGAVVEAIDAEPVDRRVRCGGRGGRTGGARRIDGEDESVDDGVGLGEFDVGAAADREAFISSLGFSVIKGTSSAENDRIQRWYEE